MIEESTVDVIEESSTKKRMDALFSIIPGIENATGITTYNADELTEEDFIKNHVVKNQGCLIKGGVKHWPAVEKWRDKEYWISTIENADVHLYTHMNYLNTERQKEGTEVVDFYDAIERLFTESDNLISLPSENINKYSHLLPIEKDITDFKFMKTIKKSRMYPPKRVFSYRGASTSWHYHDVDETLMCQVNGTKRVALLSPDIPNVKEVNDFLINEKYLSGEKLDPSLDLKPMLFDVEEGDCLYIPPYWYHGVVPVDNEVGFTVAICWKSPIHKFGGFKNFFVRRLFSQAVKPIRLMTFMYPFIALAGSISYGFKKLGNKL